MDQAQAEPKSAFSNSTTMIFTMTYSIWLQYVEQYDI